MAKRCSQPPSSASTSSAMPQTGLPSMITLSPRQHFTGHHHSSRLLNSQPEKLEETVSRTARVPPPKLLPSAVHRTDSFTTTAQLPAQMLPSSYTYSMPRSITQRPVPVSSFPGPSTAPDYLPESSSYGAFPGNFGLSQFRAPPGISRPLPINQRSLSDVAGYSMHHSLCSPPGALDPRYMLRGQSAWHPIDPSSSRSNSLPRRRAISGTAVPPRTVKWRNDVIDGASLFIF
ncbi:unnamed protein product [Onchocerca flexuosa]|uniref:Uncharacterized protein n=1 Tax=Onchocerca flexuosa TaxID=387005 RepID=A0A183HSW1_9BILA|nr:unnamed protein product [Onchocerca flexuosa]